VKNHNLAKIFYFEMFKTLMKYFFLFPVRMAGDLWAKRELIAHFTWREFAGRYRGAHLGLILSVASPLLLMVVYTVVFGFIFKGSFGGGASKVPFALALFSGLIFFQLFGDTIGRASSLLVANPGFITKVVFPLEILPLTLLGSSFLHFLCSLAVLLVGILLLTHALPWTVLLLPLLILPVLLLSLGIAWGLAAMGIYFRDLEALVPPLLMALTFLSAIFYPLSTIPQEYQLIALLNPFVGFSEMARAILIFGEVPDWRIWLYCCMVSITICLAGYFTFMRLKKGFSDAL
jgi:lipopolysaccharide transport system permease protein